MLTVVFDQMRALKTQFDYCWISGSQGKYRLVETTICTGSIPKESELQVPEMACSEALDISRVSKMKELGL